MVILVLDKFTTFRIGDGGSASAIRKKKRCIAVLRSNLIVGKVSIANVRAKRTGNQVELTWDVLDPSGDVDITVATTNHFKEGGKDEYLPAGKTSVRSGKFVYAIEGYQPFLKFLVNAPNNSANVWNVVK